MSKWQKITAQVKNAEKTFDFVFEPHLPIVIRLDGCGFKSFTKPLLNVSPAHSQSSSSSQVSEQQDKDDPLQVLLQQREQDGKRAFDNRFTRCMIQTALDMVDHFNACIGQSTSDEITLVIPPAEFKCVQVSTAAANNSDVQKKAEYHVQDQDNVMYATLRERDPTCQYKKRTHIYSGRMSKITSISAAYATQRFNYHFHNDHAFDDIQFDTSSSTSNKKIAGTDAGVTGYKRLKTSTFTKAEHLAHFDARAYTVTSANEVANILRWRQRFDGERNVVNRVGQFVYGHKKCSGMDRSVICNLIWKEYNLDILGRFSGSMKTQKDVAVDCGEGCDHIWVQAYDIDQQSSGDDRKRCYIVRPEIAFGAFIKKERVMIEAVDQKTQQKVTVERGRLAAKSLQLSDQKNVQSEENLIFSKYWN
ncbi:hypothetical protein MIR68_007050 [Amoeboaphelidium protococcarum]|nr:hypothetical protein MIR68_007050 [Amoeboaphelidium protococcarum]